MGALLVQMGGLKIGVLECFDDESQRFRFQAVSAASLGKLLSLLGCEEAGRQLVRDTVRAALDAWNRAEVRECFSAEQVARITDHLKSVPLVAEASC